MNLEQIISTTTNIPLVLANVPISISLSTSPILPTSSRLHTTPISPHSFIPQVETPLIPTSYSLEVSTPIPTPISSPLRPIISTPSTIIPLVSMEIPILETC